MGGGGAAGRSSQGPSAALEFGASLAFKTGEAAARSCCAVRRCAGRETRRTLILSTWAPPSPGPRAQPEVCEGSWDLPAVTRLGRPERPPRRESLPRVAPGCALEVTVQLRRPALPPRNLLQGSCAQAARVTSRTHARGRGGIGARIPQQARPAQHPPPEPARPETQGSTLSLFLESSGLMSGP